MAAAPIKVPSAGESISEGILARWLKPDGSAVKNGDALFELETDKASTTVTATSNGVLKIAVAEGTTVEVGSVVGSIDESATPTAAAEPAKAAPAAAAPVAAASANGGDTATLAPSVRRIVAETSVDPSQVAGTGRDGRITKGDVIAHVEGKAAPAPAAASPAPTPAPAPAAPANGIEE